jgi:hypothetical protein
VNVREHAAPANRRGNRLLAALPSRTRQEFLSSCQRVELDFAEVLCRSGDRIRDVYFPASSFISLITQLGVKEKLEVIIDGQGLEQASCHCYRSDNEMYRQVLGSKH